MKLLLGHIIVLSVLLPVPTTEAQVRTWGFTKDTVYESFSPWRPGQRDSVFLKNQATDTLKFDSVAVELPTPGKNQVELMFYRSDTLFTPIYYLRYSAGRTHYGYTSPKSVSIIPGDSLRLRNFQIDWEVLPAPESVVPGSDTIMARLIFIAAENRGRDTLIVVGIEEFKPVSLRSLQGPGDNPGGFGGRFFDPLGRRVEPAPEGVRVPAAPVIVPKE